MGVYFIDKNHIYIDDDGQKFTSISAESEKVIPKMEKKKTAFIRAFRDKYEDLYVEAKKAYKWDGEHIYDYIRLLAYKLGDDFFDYCEQQSEAYIDTWAEKGNTSAEYGTEKHFEKEYKSLEDGYYICPLNNLKYEVVGRESGISDSGIAYDNRYNLPELLFKMRRNFVINECMLVDYRKKKAGQSDKVFFQYLGNMKYNAIIGDYKTDKVIEEESFKYDGINTKKLKYPCNAIMDCNKYHYSIKMSYYAYMLSLENVKTSAMYIHHIPKDGEEKIYPLNIYMNHVKMLMQ